jgi:hypothetical protein
LVRENITLKTARGTTEILCNNTRVLGNSGIKALDISNAILELYRQIELNMQFLKEYIPGFEDAYINEVSSILGVRETRHIVGEHFLIGEEVTNPKEFEDSIALDTSAMDIHDVKGAEVEFKNYPAYHIPYRCLVPQKVEQILVAGRCISSDHIAHGRTRNMPACFSTGQAAGFAAAIAVKSKTSVRKIDVKEVQAELKKVNMPL